MAARSRTAAACALLGLSLTACATAPRPTIATIAPPLATMEPIPNPEPQPSPGPSARQKVGKPYQVKGKWHRPEHQPGYDEVGTASWYGEQFHNRHTANGEIFDMNLPSAAHKTLPLPSLVEVTNLNNGRKAVLRVNDRGPFIDGRIIDLSKAAADQLGYKQQGVARVRVRYLGAPPLTPTDGRIYQASRPQPAKPASPRVQVAAAAPPKPNGGAYALPAGWLTSPEYLDAPVPAAAQRAAAQSIQTASLDEDSHAARAAASLARTGRGPAPAQPVQRPAPAKYRVVVDGVDAAQARLMLDRLVDLGYGEAKVVAAD